MKFFFAFHSHRPNAMTWLPTTGTNSKSSVWRDINAELSVPTRRNHWVYIDQSFFICSTSKPSAPVSLIFSAGKPVNPGNLTANLLLKGNWAPLLSNIKSCFRTVKSPCDGLLFGNRYPKNIIVVKKHLRLFYPYIFFQLIFIAIKLNELIALHLALLCCCQKRLSPMSFLSIK